MTSQLLRTKSVEQSIKDTDEPGHKLKRNLTALDLTVFGVAVVIGAGIFTLGAKVAATKAGPSVTIGFVLAAVACGLAAMCYAEFASTVPVAGSAYTFSYATLGEFVAWIIGWDLMLELALGAAVVSKGWSAYLGNLFDQFGGTLSTTIEIGSLTVDWGSILIIAVLTTLLVLGTKLSARTNLVITSIKVAVVLLVIVVGFFYFNASNLKPFIPPAQPVPGGGSALDQPLLQLITGGAPSNFGLFGILSAASIVFFAFIGFDVVATAAEETRNPKRDLPRGIFGSLIIVTVLYLLVTIVVTAMVPYNELGGENATLASAFAIRGVNWAAKVIAIGALAGLTTVVMVLLLGQSRVIFAMSRDGLLPRGMAKVNERTGTPARITIGVGVIVAIVAGVVPTKDLEEMVNVGTLFAFVLVSIGVIILRRKRPDLERSYKVPWMPWIPILSVLACVWLMLNLVTFTWIRFGIWLILGILIYAFYGRTHAMLNFRGGDDALRLAQDQLTAARRGLEGESLRNAGEPADPPLPSPAESSPAESSQPESSRPESSRPEPSKPDSSGSSAPDR